jgi:hypothetical protein
MMINFPCIVNNTMYLRRTKYVAYPSGCPNNPDFKSFKLRISYDCKKKSSTKSKRNKYRKLAETKVGRKLADNAYIQRYKKDGSGSGFGTSSGSGDDPSITSSTIRDGAGGGADGEGDEEKPEQLDRVLGGSEIADILDQLENTVSQSGNFDELRGKFDVKNPVNPHLVDLW